MTRLRFTDGPQHVSPVRSADATQSASTELGELVTSFPPGHVAVVGIDGSLNIYKPDVAARADDARLPHSARLRALNARNAKFWGH